MSRLVVAGVRKLLGGRLALDGADLRWDRPGALVVFGENGAGKSTLLRVIAGILNADAGEVVIQGHRLATERVAALRHVGYAPEAAELPAHLGVGELVALVAALKRCDRPSPALVERLGLTGLLGRRFGGLSLGQRRRAGLLAALVGDPDLLLLDEPTNGLDVEGIAVMVELLRERAEAGQAAVLASHDRGFMERVAAATIELRAGRLIQEPTPPVTVSGPHGCSIFQGRHVEPGISSPSLRPSARTGSSVAVPLNRTRIRPTDRRRRTE